MEHRATYSPEDNKIRVYPANRLDDELGERYADFKAAGFKWAAKQECFVCPRWTPAAEDWALELAGEIDDEDYSPEERSADRAERFGGYREKRRGEAHDRADQFDAGPAVFAHHKQARAERAAARHDRHRTHALSQWSKAEYWQRRTEGVIAHALHRSSAPVRRSRLLRLESEQRKLLANIAQCQARYDGWKAIAEMEGADEALPENNNPYQDGDPSTWNEAQRAAYALANDGHSWWRVDHPTCEEANAKAREIHGSHYDGFSAYDLLTKAGDYLGAKFERLTPRQLATLYITKVKNPSTQESFIRWTQHYELRTGYEKAMLANEGGMAAEADIEPGGWIRSPRQPRFCLESAPTGWVQVVSVHRSPATKRVTSVKVWGSTEFYNDKTNQRERKPALVTCNVERMGEDAYRAPTAEEREAFKSKTAEAKAKKKATTPKAPSLINPTDNDAEALQALWNARAAERHAERQKESHNTLKDFEPAEVLRITQKVYALNSKGAHAKLSTRTLYDDAKLNRKCNGMWTSSGQRYDEERAKHQPICKIRTREYSDQVIVITDKPQKPLPLDWDALLPAEEPEAVCVGTNQKELF